jgi:rsbT co-antagonist protein RsbR
MPSDVEPSPFPIDHEQLRARIAELEDRLRQQERRTELILRSALEGFHIVGLDTRILDCNETFASSLGYTRDELLAMHITDVDRSPAERMDQLIGDIMAHGALRFVTKHHHKNGHVIDVEVSAHLVEIGSERFFSAFSHSIMDQLERERTLRQSEQKFRAVFDESPTLISLLSPDGGVLECNRTMLEFVGTGSSEIAGIPFWLGSFWDPPEQAHGELRRILDQAALGSPGACEIQARAGDGRSATFDLQIKPILDGGGRPTLIIAEGYDISDRKRVAAERISLQAQVISSQEAIIRELSTPLIPIDDGIAVMPLVGRLDKVRAQQLLERLLAGVTAHQARTVIVDITGVPVVDADVADALVRAAQAVKLLGAQAVLTGIRPEVAQTLVEIGADLQHIVTRSSLQSGLHYAWKRP